MATPATVAGRDEAELEGLEFGAGAADIHAGAGAEEDADQRVFDGCGEFDDDAKGDRFAALPGEGRLIAIRNG